MNGCKMIWKSLLLIIGLIVGKIQWDSVRFAYIYFPSELEVVESLASKKWHWSRRGCTFAVIRFSEASKQYLLSNGLQSITQRYRNRPQPQWFTTQHWSETPYAPRDRDDAYLDCKGHISDRLASEINIILARPGSWSYRSWSGVTIVSPEHRLAAAFRYGD